MRGVEVGQRAATPAGPARREAIGVRAWLGAAFAGEAEGAGGQAHSTTVRIFSR